MNVVAIIIYQQLVIIVVMSALISPSDSCLPGDVRLLPRLRPNDHDAGAQEGPALPPLCHAGDHPPTKKLLKLTKVQVMKDYPGVPGLFVAGVFSGALSTVSSGLNSLAAVTLRLVVVGWLVVV